MSERPALPFELVDGRRLGKTIRAILRPGELLADPRGRARRLPRFFYEVPSWEVARNTQVTPHFGLWELLDVDFREAEAARTFPRYVPCAITLLAATLEVFRDRVGTVVRIAANGGYRSPGHALNPHASPHSWGTAANIYRIGSEMMDSQDMIEKYIRQARDALPGIWTQQFGTEPGQAYDHLHLDLGYASVVPHDAPGEDES